MQIITVALMILLAVGPSNETLDEMLSVARRVKVL